MHVHLRMTSVVILSSFIYAHHKANLDLSNNVIYSATLVCTAW